MGLFAAGQVILLRYPFSDLSRYKVRPAVVLAGVDREDWIVCQITSNPVSSNLALMITTSDFVQGGLFHDSYARPDKIFTAHESLITGTAGTLTRDKFLDIRDAVIALLQRP